MPLQTLDINTKFYISFAHFPFLLPLFLHDSLQQPSSNLQASNPFLPPLSLSLSLSLSHSFSMTPWQPPSHRDTVIAQLKTVNPRSDLSTTLTPLPSRHALSLPHSLTSLNFLTSQFLSLSHSLTGLPLTAPPKVQISSIFAQIVFHSRYLFSSTNRSVIVWI